MHKLEKKEINNVTKTKYGKIKQSVGGTDSTIVTAFHIEIRWNMSITIRN